MVEIREKVTKMEQWKKRIKQILGRIKQGRQKGQPVLEYDLLREIDDVRLRLESVHSRFDYVIEEDLVDSCIYEIESLESRYQFLLRQAKQKNLICENTAVGF